MHIQSSLFDATPSIVATASKKHARSGTFSDNLKLPIHRWFRYSAGFSAEWVESVVATMQHDGHITVLDPFAGSGTTLLAASSMGATAIGYESHPFVARIARTKLLWHKISPRHLIKIAEQVIQIAKADTQPIISTSPLLQKCYSPEALSHLFSLKNAAATLDSSEHDAYKAFIELAITAILRPCSHVGTAQWQYVLPNKSKGKVLSPYDALREKIAEIAADIEYAASAGYGTDTKILAQDARDSSPLAQKSIDLVITSPPYPNNFDYADATRLEMTFWGEIDSWSDLQNSVRRHIIRSCSQHSAAERLKLDELLSLPVVEPIREELTRVCRELEVVRLTKGGRKTYHTMIAAYYADLGNVFHSLRPVCKSGAKICFVIGDSAPYGVHAPADLWLGKLAENAGFHTISFEKLRDRNTKWKNRKHTVPLHEGRLWFEG